MRSLTFLIFVFLTVCCWGVYGPVLHEGQHSMGEGVIARWKPFLAVGFAYFLIAVLYPATILLTQGEVGRWSVGGFAWSFVAGAVGAIGALGIILAFNFGGKPVFVMPLVFGCAPVVNTIVTMLMAKTIKEASWFFYLGVLVVAIGAAGVLVFKPTADKQPAGATAHSNAAVQNANAEPGQSDSQQSAANQPGLISKTTNFVLMIISIVVTALCWGAYGPVLHKGQIKMAGSRLRPFLCVGLAYFVIAVLGSLPMLPSDPGNWTFMGSTWSLVAGAAGAFGALGIIYAFNFGGRPIFVMPLVFGLAPVVNTMSTTITKGLWGQIGTPFKISLLLVIAGAVTVLITAPKPAKPQTKSKSKPLHDDDKADDRSGRQRPALSQGPPDNQEAPGEPASSAPPEQSNTETTDTNDEHE